MGENFYTAPNVLSDRILISSALVSHPTTPVQRHRSASIFTTYNVGAVLNVSSDVVTTERHLEWFRAHGIDYYQVPIADTEEASVRPDFPDAVMQVWRVCEPTGKRLLINCTAGVNRSALAAAIILWSTRWYPTPEFLLKEMRNQQGIQRGSQILLVNHEFYRFFFEWVEQREKEK